MKSSLDSLGVVLAVLIALSMAGCGSASGMYDNPSFSLSVTPSLSDAFTSFNAVVPVIDDSLFSSCTCEGSEFICSCECIGGGSVRVSAFRNSYSFSMEFDDCRAADGDRFQGSLVGTVPEAANGDQFYDDRGTLTITYDLLSFGSCTNVAGAVVMFFDAAEGADACVGTLTGECDEESVSCEVSSDCSACR